MAFCAGLWAGAARADPERVEDGGLAVHHILPSATDERIDTFSGNGFEHWAWYDASAAQHRQELVVFLGGTNATGKGSVEFNRRAAEMGFHVVSLAYPNDIAMSRFQRADDPEAFEKARLNVITGADGYEELRVNKANAIENRLVALLRYLAAHFPAENWQQYLTPGEGVRWKKVILAGQSQGGGHACLMALELHSVARVLMFGAPKDYSVAFDRPARWYAGGGLTPLNRFFAFNHTQDDHNGCTYEQQLRNYAALGLAPRYRVVNVDVASPPYGHTRLLTSEAPRANPHMAPLHDRAYTRVWEYLLTEPVE